MMKKYFMADGDMHRVAGSVRELMKFEQRNLLMPLTGIGRFDLVFLRNVLIYFDADTRRGIVERATKTCCRMPVSSLAAPSP